MKMKMKNRSHWYGINRPRYRDEHKYNKYKKVSQYDDLKCIKQHLSNTWSSNHEKLSNTEAELKKSVAYKKKRVCFKGEPTA